MPDRSVNLGLPERPARDAASKRKVSRLSLLGGQGDVYRFRLKPHGDLVVLQEEILEDLTSAFARATATDEERTVIDLASMSVGTPGANVFVHVSPNPATDLVTLSVYGLPPGTEDLRVDFASVVGEHVLSAQLTGHHRQHVDVSHLPSGTYLLRILGPRGVLAHEKCLITR